MTEEGVLGPMGAAAGSEMVAEEVGVFPGVMMTHTTNREHCWGPDKHRNAPQRHAIAGLLTMVRGSAAIIMDSMLALGEFRALQADQAHMDDNEAARRAAAGGYPLE